MCNRLVHSCSPVSVQSGINTTIFQQGGRNTAISMSYVVPTTINHENTRLTMTGFSPKTGRGLFGDAQGGHLADADDQVVAECWLRSVIQKLKFEEVSSR